VRRPEKEALVGSLHDTLGQANLLVVTQQAGLTVAQMTVLRGRMRAAGGSFKVTKNRLAKRALDGTPHAALGGLLTGPTALAFSQDPIAAAKIAVDYAKENDKFSIVGGSLGGRILDANGVRALASLPSLDELRGKLVGLLQAPASGVARLLNAPAGKLARVFAAYAKTDVAA
jgi:large subunit ribosomal protein L10